MTEEIDNNLFKWLSVLTDKLTETSAKSFVKTAYGLTKYEDKRLAEAIVQVLTSANGELFEKMKEEDTMASALFELMKPEVEKYAEIRIRENDIKHVKAMIKQGYDNNNIKLIINITDGEIDMLRKDMR